MDAVGSGGIGEALSGNADGIAEALVEGKIFMNAVEVSRGEGIASAGGALDEVGREVERGLGYDVAFGIGSDSAFFEVDDDAGGHAEVEKGLGGGFGRIEADGASGSEIVIDDGSGFDFVDDEVIDVW